MFNFLRTTFLWVLLLPYVIYFAGTASNQLVLIANHDTFPVMINPVKLDKWVGLDNLNLVEYPNGNRTAIMDEVHCVMTSHTHLNFLADIFDFHNEIESIGDLLIDLGNWLFSFCTYVWMALVVQRLRATNAV